MMLKLFLKKLLIAHIPASLALLLVFSNSVIYLAAFEAHVINVTATIERPPTMCNALSIGYWRNHDGCAGGEGESDWTNEIHAMTDNFSGIFYNITGAEICEALWTPNCPSGNNILSKRCKATAMALGDELNLVSGHLDINALIAGADDGSAAFDHLGLTYNSTVRDALAKIEQIIGNTNGSTTQQLTDAAYVAERMYTFYEDENPIAPQCVVDPITLLLSNDSLFSVSSHSEDLSVEDEDNSGDEQDSDNGKNGNNENNEHSRSDGNDDREENSNAGEQSMFEPQNSESEQSTASNDETATSTEESEITTFTTDETMQSTTGDGGNVENGGEVAVPDVAPAEDTGPTATSSEEQVQQ